MLASAKAISIPLTPTQQSIGQSDIHLGTKEERVSGLIFLLDTSKDEKKL